MVKDYPPYLDYPKPRQPLTNADRIRSITDEELVKIITEWSCPNNWSRASCHKHYELEKGCSSCWLEWLKGEWKNE